MRVGGPASHLAVAVDVEHGEELLPIDVALALGQALVHERDAALELAAVQEARVVILQAGIERGIGVIK